MCSVVTIVNSNCTAYWTWSSRSKLEVVRINIDILGNSELKWAGIGGFNPDDHHIYYCGQESHTRVWNAVLGCNFKNVGMISVHFKDKPFNITVASATNAEEAEAYQFYEDLLEPIPKTRCHLHDRGWECKSRKSRDTWRNKQVWPWSTKWSRKKANRVLPRVFWS